MFRRKAGRQAELAAAVAQLPDSALAERVAALQDVDTAAAFAQCRALVVEAVTRDAGAAPAPDVITAGVELCHHIALDDRQLTDPALSLMIGTLLQAAWSGGVHVLTATQERAAAQAESLRRSAARLGFPVALLAPGDDRERRAECYAARIVCGPTAEFAYDELRNRLAWAKDAQLVPPQQVALVEDVTTVLLEQSETPAVISSTRPVEDDSWYATADALAADLRRDEDVVFLGDRAVLTGSGVRAVAERHPLSTVYEQRVPLLPMVAAAATARDRYRDGADYDIDGGEVVVRREVPPDVVAAIAARHGLRVRAERVIWARCTMRAWLGRYQVLAGTGPVGRAEAGLLRELYGVRTRRPGADTGLPPFSKPILRTVADLVERDHLAFVELTRELTGADDVVGYWAEQHRLTFPDGRADFAERVSTVDSALGPGGMVHLIRALGDAHRTTLWRDHLIALDTLEHELRSVPEERKEQLLRWRAPEFYDQLVAAFTERVLDGILHQQIERP